MTKLNKLINKNIHKKNIYQKINHFDKKNNQSDISDIVISDVNSSEFPSSISDFSSNSSSSDSSTSNSSNSSTSDSSSSDSSTSDSSSSNSSSCGSNHIYLSDESITKKYNLKKGIHKKKSKLRDFSSDQISSTSLKEKKNYDYVFLLKNLKSVWEGLCIMLKWFFMFAINMFGKLFVLISSFLSKTIGKNTNIYDLKISKKGKNKNHNSKTFSLNKTSNVFGNGTSINSSSLNTELNLITSSLYGNKTSNPTCKKSCNVKSSYDSSDSSCSSDSSDSSCSSDSKCKPKSKCYPKCKNNNIYPINNTFTFSTLKNKISEKINSLSKHGSLNKNKIPIIKNNFENTDLVSSLSVDKNKNKKQNQKKKIIKIPKTNKNIFIKKSKQQVNNNKHNNETVANTDMMNEIYNMLNV